MWDKIEQWWNERKERRQEKKLKNALDLQIALNQLLDGGPNWVPYNIHYVPTLICSVYFESDKDITAVDFSQEEKVWCIICFLHLKKSLNIKAGKMITPIKKKFIPLLRMVLYL